MYTKKHTVKFRDVIYIWSLDVIMKMYTYIVNFECNKLGCQKRMTVAT